MEASPTERALINPVLSVSGESRGRAIGDLQLVHSKTQRSKTSNERDAQFHHAVWPERQLCGEPKGSPRHLRSRFAGGLSDPVSSIRRSQIRADTERCIRRDQGLYADLRDLPRASAKFAAEGMYITAVRSEGLPAPSGDDRYSLFGETGLHGFVRWVGELITIKTPELKRPTIVAAMFGTLPKMRTRLGSFGLKLHVAVSSMRTTTRRPCSTHGSKRRLRTRARSAN